MRCKAGLFSRPGPAISGSGWVLRSAADALFWNGICYGGGLFVAVSQGTSGRVMTSPDGINWTLRNTPFGGNAVAFGNGMYVTGASFGVMASSDAINWSAVTAPSATWRSIAYGNGQFVAVSSGGTTAPEVMTSPDGINWTARTTLTDGAGPRRWRDVVYANGIWVAVADGAPGSGYAPKIMTSPDGITWTGRSTPQVDGIDGLGEFPGWYTVAYGNGKFVCGPIYGERVITSADGITWTFANPVNKSSGAAVDWEDIAFGNGIFAGLTYGAPEGIVTSSDGISWTYTAAPQESDWRGICFGDGKFVAVSFDGASRVMTSS